MTFDRAILIQAAKKAIEVARDISTGIQADAEIVSAEYNIMMRDENKENYYEFSELQQELDKLINEGKLCGTVTRRPGGESGSRIVKVVIF